MNEIDVETALVECRLAENGIHEIFWYSNDRAAVDKYMEYIAGVYETTGPRTITRWVHRDQGIGLPSINYLLQKARELQARYPARSPTRSAILYGSGIKLLMLNGLIILANTIGRDTTRFFPQGEDTKALEWLLRDR
jgi:hypothetical protein